MYKLKLEFSKPTFSPPNATLPQKHHCQISESFNETTGWKDNTNDTFFIVKVSGANLTMEHMETLIASPLMNATINGKLKYWTTFLSLYSDQLLIRPMCNHTIWISKRSMCGACADYNGLVRLN